MATINHYADAILQRRQVRLVMGVTIREMRSDELEDVFRMYATAFGEDSLALWQKRFDWEFKHSPRTNGKLSKMWVAENPDGKLLGYIGSFPMLLKVGDRDLLTSSSGDLLVLPEARGLGLGQKLSQAYRDAAGELATDGFGYQPVTGRIYRRLGYQPVRCQPMYLRPLDLRPIFEFLVASGRLPSPFRNPVMTGFGRLLSAVFNPLLWLANRVRWPRVSNGLAIEPLEQIGEEIDDLWKRLSPEFVIAFVRDQAFLRWRFQEDPSVKHTILAARDASGTLLGFLAYTVYPKSVMEIGRIMDLFCSPTRTDVIDSLVSTALSKIRDRGAAAVLCMGMHPKIRARLRKFLFLEARGEQSPSLLYCTGDDDMKRMVYNADNWHVTRADGDEGFAL